MPDRADELAAIEAGIAAGKRRRYEMADPLDAEIGRLVRGDGGKRRLGSTMRERIARAHGAARKARAAEFPDRCRIMTIMENRVRYSFANRRD